MSQPSSSLPASQTILRRLENAYLRRGRGRRDYELLAEARRHIAGEGKLIETLLAIKAASHDGNVRAIAHAAVVEFKRRRP